MTSASIAALDLTTLPPVTDVLVIDARVHDKDAFMASAGPGTMVLVLDNQRDGFEQIAEALHGMTGIASIRLVAHGWEGDVWLGSSYVDSAALDAHGDTLAAIGQSLIPEGDLLVYSCNLGAGDDGRAFVQQLAALTGADVAASDDRTGGVGGDLDLEIQTGTIEAATLLDGSLNHSLATLTVTSNGDSGAGTLRQSIADAAAGDTITFNAGMTITLSTGQLSIGKNLTIDGDLDNNGTPDVTVDANYGSRVFSISSGSVTLDGLTITKGIVYGGGGNGGLGLSPATVGGSALGAGIYLSGGILNLSHSTLSSNAASGGGGGGSGNNGYSFGGGGGGGMNGHGGGSGGAGSDYGIAVPGSSAASGSGGNGGLASVGNGNQGGKGGSTFGGAGGGSMSGTFAQGSGGASANAGSLSIGGGGGGAGFRQSGTILGGDGGNAAAGLFIASGATANLFATTFSGNVAAGGGGGGGGSGTGTGSSGGVGSAAILVAGTLNYHGSTVSVSGNSGVGGGGGWAEASTTGPSGASGDIIRLAGSINSNWSPYPTVTDAKISISGASGTGGAYKIGDTVTATWNNTASGDNNSDIISLTVDFSQFGGGSAVTASNSSGTWTAAYTIVSGSVDTTSRNVSVTATNASGNTTTADTTNATVDNIAPIVTDAKVTISGASGTGGVYKIGDTVTATWDNTASGDSNADTVSGVTVNLSEFGGGSAVAASNSSGVWTATYTIVSGAVEATGKNVLVTVSDNAGNTTTATDTTNATVDNIAPTTAVSTIALSADTGVSSSDFITATAAQTLSGTLSGNLTAGESVLVSLDNGNTWTAATTTVGQNTWSLSGQTFTGSNTIKVRVTDAAGNTGNSLPQAYMLDASAPAAPSAPDLSSSTDTGSANSDNITSATTPAFTGTAESGSTVTLYDTDGTTVLGAATATGGNWSITSSALSAGSHTVTVKATDVAGNVSSASSGLSVTIDNTAPTALSLNTTSISVASATSTATVSSLSATDAQSITYSLATGNGTNDADNGSFTITSSSLRVGGASLTAGTYKIYVAATDVAGNVAYQAFTVTVVSAPSVSSIIRTGGASPAVVSSATSIGYTVTFDQVVTGVDASDFTLTTTGTAAGSVASVSGSGSTYSVTVGSLSGDGNLRLDLNASGTGIQNGGSDSISAGYTAGAIYTLDRSAPAVPSAPDLSIGSDSGSSTTDNTTNVTTPTFTGTAESGSTVALYDTDGTTVLGSATAVGGNWSITSSALSEGVHTVTARATDAAGNTSAGSAGLTVTVDNLAPAFNSALSVPGNNVSAVRVGSDLLLKFGERIDAVGSDFSKVYLKTVATSASILATISVNGSGDLVIRPNTPLSYGTAYYVNWDANVLKDIAGNAAPAVNNQTTYNFTTELEPDPGPPVTTQTVDGALVQTTTTTTGTSTVTTQTVTPIAISRADDPTTPNSTLADIPLVSSGQAQLFAGLPVGAGLIVQQVTNSSSVRSELVQAIQMIAKGLDQSEMTEIGMGFLQTLPMNSNLIMRTVTPIVAAGITELMQPIMLSASQNLGQSQEALVIDARNLPSGSVISLGNIEFAAVIGVARFTGGAGSQVITGDSARQFIVLGADDDVLHGGGGDDVVGSHGGNDQLYGDAGDDVVVGGIGDDLVSGGEGNDLLQGGASDAGRWTFKLNNLGHLNASFKPENSDLANGSGATASGQWTTPTGQGILTDPRFSWIHGDYGLAKDLALLTQALLGRAPSLDDLGSLTHGNYTSAQLGDLAHHLWQLIVETASTESLATQIQTIATHVLGAANTTDALIQEGVNHLQAGGSWSDIWLALARSSVNAARLKDSEGLITLASQALGETGWASESGDDVLFGGGGNDVLVGGRGNDTLDGGLGTDIAVFFGSVSDYQIALHHNTSMGSYELLVRQQSLGEVDVVRDIEMFKIGASIYRLVSSLPIPAEDVFVALSDYAQETTVSLALTGLSSFTGIDVGGAFMGPSGATLSA